MKISNALLGIIILVISLGFYFMNTYTSNKYKTQPEVNFIINVKADSIVKKESAYYIYTKPYLIKLDIRKYTRYISPTDTIVTIVDTFGIVVAKDVQINKINHGTQIRLIELISLTKTE